MAFQLTTARTGRRRRVLTEELISPGNGEADAVAAKPNGSRARRPGSRYTEAARDQAGWQITRCLPRRYTTIAAGVLAATGIVAGLELLYASAAARAAETGGRVLAFADLNSLGGLGAGSLAVWFSTQLLVVAAVVSLMIYSIRRHRVDDYKGRYRVWLWAAMGWFVLSLNTTAALHRPLAEWLVQRTGWGASSGGAVWWLALALLLLAVVGSRLLVELLECRLAFAALLASWAALATAVATSLGWLTFQPLQTHIMVTGGLVLGGYCLTLTALVLYARHVLLDAEGLMPVRPAANRPSRRERGEGKAPTSARSTPGGSAYTDHNGVSPGKSAPVGRRSSRTGDRVSDLDGYSSRQRASRKAAKPRASAAQKVDDVDEDDEYQQQIRKKISKSERKRLRREKMRERQ